jgi:hypothetical protein
LPSPKPEGSDRDWDRADLDWLAVEVKWLTDKQITKLLNGWPGEYRFAPGTPVHAAGMSRLRTLRYITAHPSPGVTYKFSNSQDYVERVQVDEPVGVHLALNGAIRCSYNIGPNEWLGY